MKSYRRDRPTALAVLALMPAVFASGCAQFVAEGEQARQGWREARVVQIGAAASIDRGATLDCRVGGTFEAATGPQYAVYQYRSAGGRFHVIAPLPSASALKVGDPVRVNTKTCSLAPISR
jgi:hypothetical protein